MGIIIKSPDEVAIMRRAGSVVAIVLERLAREIGPGMKTKELDRICVEELGKRRARASFKGYRGFPATL